MTPGEQTTYYTVADRHFFPGVVALINSLELTGNDGDVVVLDLGLLPEQRARLDGHVTVVQPPSQIAGNPLLSKPFAYLLAPTGVAVVIDSDMVVVATLDAVIAAAAGGQICVFTDETQDPRWFPEWQDVFALQAPLRRTRSLNSGFVALSTTHWPELLSRWWELCCRVPADATRARGAAWEQPFWDGDQDALNALLMSEIPESAVSTWPQQVTDLLMDVDVVDATTLECAHRSVRARVLHHTGGPKPWEPAAWMRVQRNAYVQLLPRLLFGPDVRIRLSPGDVPRWLAPGATGRASLEALALVNRASRLVVSRTVSRTSGRTRERAMRLRGVLVGLRRG